MTVIDAYVITHLEKGIWGIAKCTKGANTDIDEFYSITSFVKIYQIVAILKFRTSINVY